MLAFQKENRTKLGKIAHFSTMPYDTCAQKCKYCYAMKSVNQYPATKANYTKNTDALNNGESLPDIPNRDVVRMYVAGDFQNLHAVNEWIRLSMSNPQVKFFGYTKQWLNPTLLPALEKLKNRPNVVLRASVDKETGYAVPKTWTKAGIYENNASLSHVKAKDYYICNFKESKNKCDVCRVCFSSKQQHKAVFFPRH